MADENDYKVTYDNYGPFGDAEASRVDFHKLRNSYINLSNTRPESTTDTIDTSARIIVGRKGSGKTLYLRLIQHYNRLVSNRFSLSKIRSRLSNYHPIPNCKQLCHSR